jgi:hypothetical protein
MSTWDEYADLLRRLDHLVSAGERARVEAAAHASTEQNAAAQLDRRLAAQGQRVANLGESIGSRTGAAPPAPWEDALAAAQRYPEGPLAAAHRYADAADAAALEAELLAQRPPLLPALSPPVRALVVYAMAAAATALVQFALLVIAEPEVIGPFALYAWMCAGLPAMAFFAGYLVLTVWGRPRVLADPPARYPGPGFAICFLSTPILYCGYSLLRLAA